MSKRISCCCIAVVLFVAAGADWPMYRGNAGRTGYTAEELPENLALAWVYRPIQPPMPAWPRDDRMLFDRTYDVVVAGDLLFFGTVSDRVVALDAATGRQRWIFVTDAPVRFAPAVWKEKVFVASDDGHLYCLKAADGSLIQKWRGGPGGKMILGNGRMVSRWPARGGPVIHDGIVYFGAGIWQSDGVFLLAIDAETGEVVWRNDEAGKIYMPQPHGGAMADSGVSAQGYFVATDEQLIVPTGRAVPASFARRDGRFQYYHLQANGRVGGSQAVAIGPAFYNGGLAFNLATGAQEAKPGAGVVAATSKGLVLSTKRELRAMSRVEKSVPDRKGVPVAGVEYKTEWTVADVAGGDSVMVAGDTIFCGGEKKITRVDGKTHQANWTAPVDGIPYGLAAANRRLYVSTDRGTIYCYAPGAKSRQYIPALPRRFLDRVAGRYGAAADEIIQRTGVKQGYCLDLDCGDGSLAIALARRTDLQIYALTTAENLAAVRAKIRLTGMYGVRITVHQGDAANIPYDKYFADLVVSQQSLDDGPLDYSPDGPPAALRPFGGWMCTGKTGEMDVFQRGALANTGVWTHQYSDAGNTGCSTDDVVKGHLRTLWFRDVDLEMPQRHGRGPAPLFYQGRMFVEGLDALRAVDAYNGRNLWEFKLPGVLKAYSAEHLNGTAVTGSNFCLSGASVYVHDSQHCYRLDAATGRKLDQFSAPKQPDGQPGRWGYISCDGKRLFGSLVNTKHRVRYAYWRADMTDMLGEAMTLFALDPQTGDFLWRYDASESIRNNAIAMGADRVYLIDRRVAEEDKWDPTNTAAKLPPVTKVDHEPGRLIALDAATGKLLWKSEKAFGTMLAYCASHDALLMSYQATRFKLPSEIGGRLAVYRGHTGQPLWEKQASYGTRPLINDKTIYAQGGAWDLTSGEERPFDFKRSYGCGQLAGSKNMLLFRSATLGYFDLTRGSGTENFGGIRPGCWINALPVGGLVLVPDASAGCSCSYQNRSWMALTGDE